MALVISPLPPLAPNFISPVAGALYDSFYEAFDLYLFLHSCHDSVWLVIGRLSLLSLSAYD